jgi:hypothetical protein
MLLLLQLLLQFIKLVVWDESVALAACSTPSHGTVAVVRIGCLAASIAEVAATYAPGVLV